MTSHRRTVRTEWVELETLPISWANVFQSTFQPGEFVLSFGQLVPPAVTGETEEEREAFLSNIGSVSIRPVARIALTRHRMEELVRALQENLANHDAALKEVE